nr:hypothetical protein [Mycoplasmopsis bovis]
MKLKKIFNKYITIVPALVTIPLIAAKCEYDPRCESLLWLKSIKTRGSRKRIIRAYW